MKPNMKLFHLRLLNEFYNYKDQVETHILFSSLDKQEFCTKNTSVRVVGGWCSLSGEVSIAFPLESNS